MTREKNPHKIISIYSNTGGLNKSGYAINLAASIAKVTEKKVALVSVGAISEEDRNTLNLVGHADVGIDVVTLDSIKPKRLGEIGNKYKYVIVDLLLEESGLLYEIFAQTDVIHFFVDSVKENLKKAHEFFDELLEKRLKEVHDKIEIVVNKLDVFDKLTVEDMSWLIKRDVGVVLSELSILDVFVDAKGIPFVLRETDSDYSEKLFRIAKRETGRLLGLALGSGAAFGLAHIGVLKVLEENHITIDMLAGSSIGALFASAWGLGYSSKKIEQIAKKFKRRFNIVGLLDFTLPVSGILAGRRLKRFLKKVLREKKFEDLKTPVKIVVYDLANREIIVKEKGSLVEAVYMSIAVPGIFEPKVEKDRVLIDGGVGDPVPVDILLKAGAQKVIAVNVLPSPADIARRNMILKKRREKEEELMSKGPFHLRCGIWLKNFFGKIFTPNIFDVIVTSMQSIEYMLAEDNCKKADIALHPVFAGATSIDFYYVMEFIKKGEEEANFYIEDIKKLAFK